MRPYSVDTLKSCSLATCMYISPMLRDCKAFGALRA